MNYELYQAMKKQKNTPISSTYLDELRKMGATEEEIEEERKRMNQESSEDVVEYDDIEIIENSKRKK